jgi:predicted O-methyltransferase YrrM
LLKHEIKQFKDTFACTVKEGKLLYKLARKSQGTIVEIGSWKGFSTIWLAKGSLKGNKYFVYAIDTFAGDIKHFVSGEGSTFQQFLDNIKKANVYNIVQPIKMTSAQAESERGDSPIGLIFIDGDHDDADNDFMRWNKHLQIGGYMVLHDTIFWHDQKPFKVAVKELYKSNNFADVKRVGCITYGRKVEHLTKYQKMTNRISLFRRYIFQFFQPYYIRLQQIGERILK